MDSDVLLLYLMTFAAVRDVTIKSADARLDVNVALGRPSYQSSIYEDIPASFANDGNFTVSYPFCAHTDEEVNPWWAVDLGAKLYVIGVNFTNRDAEGSCSLS